MSESQVKSKQRVADHGEVFTAEREVNAMLDLVKPETERIDSRFLEPACGEGAFLTEILRRKLATVKAQYGKSPYDYERYAVLAATSIYGVDILQDNVEVCRRQLFEIWDKAYTATAKEQANEGSYSPSSAVLCVAAKKNHRQRSKNALPYSKKKGLMQNGKTQSERRGQYPQAQRRALGRALRRRTRRERKAHPQERPRQNAGRGQGIELLVAEHEKHPDNPYLFPSPRTGEMYHPDSVVNLHRRILKNAGLEPIRLHDLRHTFATLALQNGVDIKTVSGMLGHYDAGFTLPNTRYYVDAWDFYHNGIFQYTRYCLMQI